MDLTSKKNIQGLLKKCQINPSKRLGQNFLTNKRAVKRLIRAAALKPENIVLEIGPGIGTLTQELAKKVKKVIAVEKDPNLARILNDELRIMGIKNVKVIQADILKFPNHRLPNTDYKIIGNLPFYLTAPVIRKFLEFVEIKPRQMVLIVQKEVGQRICAKPPKMNILAVSVQFYAKPEVIGCVSKKSFWPSPKVDSAILRIAPLVGTFRKPVDADLFFKIVRAGFSQPRKQLINNLSKGLKINRERIKDWLLKNNVQPNQRAETLTVENWVKLTKKF